jgi:DNA-binding HxlR family transcriptional regulator
VRSYQQFCALARALDIVGDRWTLLIVRELSIRPSRYRDLLDGLPGIATNLLADRLRALEEHGLVVAEELPPPSGATVYRLTDRGEELVPSLLSLASWGEREMLRGQGEDSFRAHWLTVPVATLTDGIDTDGVAPLRVRLETAGGAVDAVIDADGVHTELHPTADADVVVAGEPMQVLQTVVGARDDTIVDGSTRARRRFAELARRVRRERAHLLEGVAGS